MPKPKYEDVLVTETTEHGIKVSLGGDEWILFKRDGWSWPDRVRWTNANDIAAMLLLLDWTINWHIQDANGAWIPFERDALKNDLTRLNISYAKSRRLSLAVFFAFSEAANFPLS